MAIQTMKRDQDPRMGEAGHNAGDEMREERKVLTAVVCPSKSSH
jgi:hypothetical protein